MKDQSLARKAACLILAGLASTNASAQEAGDFTVSARVGLATVDADTAGVPNFQSGVGFIPDTSVNLDDAELYSLTPSYMLTDMIAVEALIALPANTSVNVDGLQNAGVSSIGDVSIIVPTIYAALYPAKPSSRLQPSVAAGLGVLIFTDSSTSQDLTGAFGSGTKADFKRDGISWSLRAGLDYKIAPRWSIGAHYSYFNSSAVATVHPGVAPIPAFSTQVDLDVHVFQIGFGRRF